MYQKVKAYMKEHGMVVDGDVVLAGVSGGGDSMAMLEMLKRYQAEATFSLCAVHVHHGIRGEEADRDERVVRETCEKWTIPFLSYHYPVPELAKKWKMGLEETGRKVRQDAFSRAEADYFGKSETADLQGGGRVSAAREGKLRIRIALAHNENDVAETLLHNLCRGTGLKGLASILPVRDEIIRPILCLNKQEIVNYLIKEQIPYVTDSTNLEDEYTRNKIRLNLLPLMQEINPSVKKNLIGTSNYLNNVATIYNKCIEETKNNIVTTEGIRISDLVKEPAPEAILFEILHPLGFNSAQIKDIAFSLHSQPGKQFCSKKWRVIKDREFLLIEAIESGNEILPPFQIIKEEKEYTPDFLIPRDKGIACFDADKLNGDIHYRKWQTGDTFIPFGMKGKKKISDYLTDRKFSISQKERQWVLCCGEHIAWLIGERTDNRFRIDKTTKRIVIYKIV